MRKSTTLLRIFFILSSLLTFSFVESGSTGEGGSCTVEYNTNSEKYQETGPGNTRCDNHLTCIPTDDSGEADVDLPGTCEDTTIDDDAGRITICHRTCSETNPWVRITIDSSAWSWDDDDTGKHNQHSILTCGGNKDLTKWGENQSDYILKIHGSRNEVATSLNDDSTAINNYWDEWEPACPARRGEACCTSGESCCNGSSPTTSDDPSSDDDSSAPSTPPSTSIEPSLAPSDDPSLAPSTTPVNQFECVSDGLVAEPLLQLKNDQCKESVSLSTEPHVSDSNGVLELIVQIDDQFVSNTGYQPQLVLFFAKPTATLEDVTTNDNGWSYFESKVVSYMKAKIFCCMDHTWFYAKTLDDQNELQMQRASYKKQMKKNGAMKIRRDDEGKVSYWYSFNKGTTWTQIGSDVLLPEEYRTGPLKVGYRVKREWKCHFDFKTKVSITSGGKKRDIC